MTEPASGVRLFTTIPPAGRGGHPGRDDYRQLVRRTARMSEEAGFEGALVYSDNNTVDPWVVAQDVVLATERFKPLVALQPVYSHPYTVAKTIASYGLMYGRSVCLNLVAGGNRSDLAALDDATEHDQRYERLTEYARLITLLLAGAGPVTFDGDFYRVRTLGMFPALPEHLAPELFISGSSEAGRRAGERLGALALRYPQPPGTGDPGPHNDLGGGGVRIGIIARDCDQEAWSVARDRFPDTRAGRMLQRMARNSSDSEWITRLSESEEFPAGAGSPYWMGPFKTYATFCPYLVGSYERVAAEVTRFVDLGCRTFILDTARAESDYADITTVFSHVATHRTDTASSPALAI
jgi:alkanesulfonate monooxygenase